MAEISDEAILLRRIPFSDASLVCHFFTRQHGRIALMARGARRAKSSFRAALEPLYDLQIIWRPGRTGMGSLLDLNRGAKILNDNLHLEGLELCSVASGLFQEGDPHGYEELRNALMLMQNREGRIGLLAAMWQLLHDAGWVGDIDHCWQCGIKVGQGDPMAWQGSELVCQRCGSGMSIAAGMRKSMMAQSASAHVRMGESDLSGWQKMIQDVLREHGVYAQSLFQERK